MNEISLADAPARAGRGLIAWVENKSILTPTSGYLAPGFTHTINAYQGCSFAGALCGTFCYAQHNHWITHGREWGLYGAKADVRSAYRRDHDRIKRPARGEPGRLVIYMSSSTDPYLPQESRLGLTRALLEEMLERPPDALVIQTHHIQIERDVDLIVALSLKCRVWASITVETDQERLPGFPPHACSPRRRLETLGRLRASGILTQAAVSPLLPLADVEGFGRRLDAACDRVILDHFLIGDGSPGGARTRRTSLIERLAGSGQERWSRLDVLWETRDALAGILGASRVLVGREGFCAV